MVATGQIMYKCGLLYKKAMMIFIDVSTPKVFTTLIEAEKSPGETLISPKPFQTSAVRICFVSLSSVSIFVDI